MVLHEKTGEVVVQHHATSFHLLQVPSKAVGKYPTEKQQNTVPTTDVLPTNSKRKLTYEEIMAVLKTPQKLLHERY
jgi:hypothetical protein